MIDIINEQIVVEQVKHKYTLEELVAQMRPEHNIAELIKGEIGEERLEY